MSRGTSWLGLLRERAAFRRLWLADVVSLLGDWLTYVAVSLLALERGEGLVAVSLVLVAHALPSTLLAPFAGWFIDRWDRRRVLVVTNLARGGLALGMAYAAAVGSLGGVQLLLLVRIALAAFSDPAVTASLPKVLADPDSAASSDALSSNATAPRSARLLADLGTANRLIGATWSVLFALGVAAGGVAAAFLGPTYAILLDAGTFFLAAWIARGLPRLEPEQNAERGGTLFGELFAALVHVKGDRRILEAALAKTPAAIVNGGGLGAAQRARPESGRRELVRRDGALSRRAAVRARVRYGSWSGALGSLVAGRSLSLVVERDHLECVRRCGGPGARAERRLARGGGVRVGHWSRRELGGSDHSPTTLGAGSPARPPRGAGSLRPHAGPVRGRAARRHRRSALREAQRLGLDWSRPRSFRLANAQATGSARP